jgi:hypothetical protein
MIWPPVHGRLILHDVATAPIEPQRQPNGDWIGSDGTHWYLHSPAEASFDSLEAGRESLVGWARLHAASAHVISSERCIVLCADHDGRHRLWQIARIEASLRDEFNKALDEDPATIARCLLKLTRAFLLAAERFADAACWLPLNMRQVGVRPGGVHFLGPMPNPDAYRAPTARTPEAALKLLAVQLEYALADIEPSRRAIGTELDRLIALDAANDAASAFAKRYLASGDV